MGYKSSLFFILFLVFSSPPIFAQKLATKIIVLHDSAILQFTDVNELYFLYDRQNSKLQQNVKKLTECESQLKADIIIEKIAKLRSTESAVILSLDYFFKNQKPVIGSNVEKVLAFLQKSAAYDLINQYHLQNSIDKDCHAAIYKQKIQDTLGWKYGYGAFYYLSPEDSFYLAHMKKINVSDIDKKVKNIIKHYLKQQQEVYQYDRKSILKEVLNIDGIKDAQWDDCVIKTMQLPNWDRLGIVIVSGRDTIERVYTIQYSKSSVLRFGKHVRIPIKRIHDILWYQGVSYGLHFVKQTRAQCEENARSH